MDCDARGNRGCHPGIPDDQWKRDRRFRPLDHYPLCGVLVVVHFSSLAMANDYAAQVELISKDWHSIDEYIFQLALRRPVLSAAKEILRKACPAKLN